MSKRILLAVTALFLMVGLSNPSSLVRAQYINGPQANTNAKFQVVLAATISTNVDVFVDGTITSESGLNATKPLNASGFVVVTPGNHTITLKQTGTAISVGTPFLFNFPVGPQSLTSLVLLPDLTTWITFNDVAAQPAPSQATARVINLSPNNDPVDITVDSTAPATFQGTVYQTASGYQSFSAQSHTVMIPGNPATTITRTFIDGNVYSIFVFWDSTNTKPKVLLSTEFSFNKNKFIYLPSIFK